MAQIASRPALLHAALQDIHAGLADQHARLPATATDDKLTQFLTTERGRTGEFATALEADGLNPAGLGNLWMAGVLDDAARDETATQSGRLLDIALAGAIRKGKVAEAAACDTALALAEREVAVTTIARIRESAQAGETLLAGIITRLAQA